MHMRSIEALQSENPNFPKARTWNAYVVPGARLLTVVGGFVLGDFKKANDLDRGKIFRMCWDMQAVLRHVSWIRRRLRQLRSASRGYVERSASFAPQSVAKSDRKSTRLNSSHSQISYAVFCLKKKKKVI